MIPNAVKLTMKTNCIPGMKTRKETHDSHFLIKLQLCKAFTVPGTTQMPYAPYSVPTLKTSQGYGGYFYFVYDKTEV